MLALALLILACNVFSDSLIIASYCYSSRMFAMYMYFLFNVHMKTFDWMSKVKQLRLVSM